MQWNRRCPWGPSIDGTSYLSMDGIEKFAPPPIGFGGMGGGGVLLEFIDRKSRGARSLQVVFDYLDSGLAPLMENSVGEDAEVSIQMTMV